MLAKLFIRNYALIDTLDVELDGGFNILTGETGAGKSLLLGAIGLILGRRVDYSYIFNPDQKCIVEATFRSIPPQILADLGQMEEFDIEDAEIIVRREARANGKSRAFINDTPVSLSLLRDVTGRLVDLHGQHENQLLLSQEQQVRLLDEYAGVRDRVRDFGGLLRTEQALRKEIAQLEADEREARKQEDFVKFQFKELDEAQLDAEEEAQLEEELQTLENAEEIKESLGFATDGLYDAEESLYNRLSEIIARLQSPAQLNSAIREQYERLEEVRYAMEDAARELESTNDTIDLDPGALADMQARMDLLNRLKVKYTAADVADLIRQRDALDAQLGHFGSLGDQIAARQRELAALRQQLLAQGLKIEKARLAAAKKLKKTIDKLLHAVALEGAEFAVEVRRLPDPQGALEIEGQPHKVTPTGLNHVDFRIRTNPGMPMGPLSQVASGGEVSRVMLAIKAALAEQAELSVLIFDEIDTGISGETAQRVGAVMQQLAERYQIIAITHLPQIAGKGARHFKIFKEVIAGKTVSRLRALEPENRILELARMLSGADPTPSAIENARELISSQKKARFDG
ncbi:MAG: DNA repair protein RecN [Bacteroidota bacterium]